MNATSNDNETAPELTTQPEAAGTQPVKSLTIRDIELPVWQAFVGIKKRRNIHYNQLFQEVFRFYQNFYFDLNDEELALMQQASKLAPHTLTSRTKKLTLRYAQNIITTGNKPAKPINLQAKNSAAAAKARANSLLQEIMTHNDNACHWYDKILITKSAILEYAKKKKQQDSASLSLGHLVLSSCLERHQEEIEAHHKQHGLDPKHNSRAYYERSRTNNNKETIND